MNSFAQATGWAWLAHPDGGAAVVRGRSGRDAADARALGQRQDRSWG